MAKDMEGMLKIEDRDILYTEITTFYNILASMKSMNYKRK